MIKRVKEEQMTIMECYEKFSITKLSEGIGKVGTKPYFNEVMHFLNMTDIKPDDYVSIITESDVHHYALTMRKKDLSIASINHYMRSVRVFLYWCMKNDYIKEFKISMVKGQEEKLKFYSDSDIEKLLKKPGKDSDFVEWRNYVITCFIMSTGARASTVLNIRNTDIDFRSHEITFTHLKNKQVTSVPLGSTLERVLTDYLRLWKRSTDEYWLFPEINESQLTVTALGHSYAKYCKKRGVERKGIHALRHTFARGWIKNGGNAFTLQHMLTHSDLTMTKKYVRLFADDLKEGFEEYSPLDKMSKKTGKIVRA